MNKRKLLLNLTLLFLLVFLVGSVYQRPFNERIIIIEQGMNTKEIAYLLKEDQLISSPYLFMAYAALKDDAGKLRPGCYDLNTNMGWGGMLEKISRGDTYGVKVTIPEGFNSWQIANLLANRRLVNKNVFLRLVREKDLEGYLYPATYAVVPGARAEEIVQMMVEKFNNVFGDDLLKRSQKLNMTQRQVLTLASLIEREAKLEGEKPEISAVFHNRLQKKWLLESCATVQYALGKNKQTLSYNDLKIRSPYNTYIHPGLPPGPICNPSSSSIKAALYPASSDKLFFIAEGDGTHKFSKYYREHLQEKSRLHKKS